MDLATDMCGRFTFRDRNTDIDEVVAEVFDLTRNGLTFNGIYVHRGPPPDQARCRIAVTVSSPKK